MVFSELVQRFEKEAAICVMVRATLENVLSAERMDGIFEQSGYSQEGNRLLFSTVAEIMGLVACRIRPSVHAAFQAKAAEIGVTAKAIYDKLQGIRPEVSRAIVRDLAAEMGQIIEKTKGVLPPLLPGYRTMILDGNHLQRTERRLGVLRPLNAAPLPGHALVVHDPQRKLVVDVFPCEDGHAQERSLLPAVLETVQRRDLWIADRNFCTTGFLAGIHARQACFVIRQHAGLPLQRVAARVRAGTCETGTLFEQSVRLVDAAGTTHTLRCVTVKLKRPTRDGDKEIHILTNLPKRVAAATVAKLYAKRWTIETAFQEVAENLEGEINTLGYPKAALFGFCMALVVYNLLSVVRAALRAAHGIQEVEERVSVYYLADEVAQTYRGLTIALPSTYWKNTYGHLTALQLARQLIRIAKGVRLARYRKHQRGPKKPPPSMNKKRRNHISTARVLMEADHCC